MKCTIVSIDKTRDFVRFKDGFNGVRNRNNGGNGITEIIV
jgi:hypothetical protein